MSPLGKKLVKSVSIYRYKRINNKDYKMKSTLTIPTPNIGGASGAGEDTVLDIDEISLVQQTSNTTTTIYTQKASEGDVNLTHNTMANGSMADLINELLLKSAGGNAVIRMPSGVSVTSITFT
jgi:hypothetical protein